MDSSCLPLNLPNGTFPLIDCDKEAEIPEDLTPLDELQQVLYDITDLSYVPHLYIDLIHIMLTIDYGLVKDPFFGEWFPILQSIKFNINPKLSMGVAGHNHRMNLVMMFLVKIIFFKDLYIVDQLAKKEFGGRTKIDVYEFLELIINEQFLDLIIKDEEEELSPQSSNIWTSNEIFCQIIKLVKRHGQGFL